MDFSAISPQERDQIIANIKVMVGGNFTPDALGPDVYNNMLTHAQQYADAYLNVFEEVFLGANFDAMLQSRLHLPHMLDLLTKSVPERTHEVAERLLRQYDAVLVVYDSVHDRQALTTLLSEETMRLAERLDSRRNHLRQLIGNKQ